MTSICGTEYKYETVPDKDHVITGYDRSAITVGTQIYDLTVGMSPITVMVMKEPLVTPLATMKARAIDTGSASAKKHRRERLC